MKEQPCGYVEKEHPDRGHSLKAEPALQFEEQQGGERGRSRTHRMESKRRPVKVVMEGPILQGPLGLLHLSAVGKHRGL